MRIPPISTFDPNRVAYKIGNQLIYAQKGVGKVNVTPKGTIILQDMKGLGLGDTASNRESVNMIIRNSEINVLYKNLKDNIKLIGCKFKTVEPEPKRWVPKVDVIYTNKP